MAFDEYDDFEQEKLVKDWIKNNWLTIAAGIVIGLGSVMGINYWKDQQQQKRFKMAEKYSSFSEVMQLAEFDEAKTMLAEMEKDSASNLYIIEAHLTLAKEYVNKNELEKAQGELQAIIAKKPDQLLTEFVKLRLARVYNAMGKNDEALSTVSAIATESFESISKEIQGDAYSAKGNAQKAKEAYEVAAKGEGYSGKRNIEMKLENS